MKGLHGRGALVSTLLLLAACVHVENVPGPDGEEAHLIRCSSSAKCFETAAAICNGANYVLRSDNAVSYSALTARSAPGGSTEILISCKSYLRAAPRPKRATESDVCDEASADAVDFAIYWAAHAPHARALLEMPKPKDFGALCVAMPEAAQRCMRTSYRTAHAASCDAVLLRLDPSPRNKVDAMFLEAPKSQAPASDGTPAGA
jgi:hypothetical protein